jgi:hypothetical protein
MKLKGRAAEIVYHSGKGAAKFIPRIVAMGWKKKIKGPSYKKC